MEEHIDEITKTVRIKGFSVETVDNQPSYSKITLLKGGMRKKRVYLGLSTGLMGLLAVEREISRLSKKDMSLIYDPTVSLESTSFPNVKLVHTIEDLVSSLP